MNVILFTGIVQEFFLFLRSTCLTERFELLLPFISIERLHKECIFPRKILLSGVLKFENTTLQTI